MHRVFPVIVVLCFCLPLVVAAQSAPVDKGTLETGAAKSDLLPLNEAHLYRLALPENAPFTISALIQPGNAAVYGYVVDNNGKQLEPADRAFRDSTLTQVYGLCPAPPCSLVLEGEGSYTLTLSEGNTLHRAEEVLKPGDTVNGTLPERQERAYRLETDSEATITLTIAEDRQPVYVRLSDSTGQHLQPLSEHYDALAGIRAQVLSISNAASPLELLVSGAGRYTLRIDPGDTLRLDSGELAPGEEKTAPKPATGYALYTLTGISAKTISVAFGNGARDVFLHDATGQRLFAETTFIDRASLQRTAVFGLSGSAPYTLTVYAENSYALSVIDSDISRVDSGVLRPGMVTALDVPPGMTPVFTLESADESIIIHLIFSERTRFDTLDLQFHGADGSLVVPEHIAPSAGGLLIQGFPANVCPCEFIPRVSGRFTISIVGEMPELTVPVLLLQSDVNLRAGANLRAPVIAIGGKDEQLHAFARSEDNQWLLAMTGDSLIVWVFRQLTAATGGHDLDVLPAANSTTVIEEVEATEAVAEEPAESTPDAVPATAIPMITAVAVTLLPASTTDQPQGTPGAFSCMITSGGGINMRQGAGMEFPIAGSLTDGATTGVIAQSYDTDGNIWWQLDNSRWVRADVVVEIGDCTTAPVQKPG